MNREDDQSLWDLLGKMGEPEVSPFFARNVLRKIREERSWRANLVRFLSARRLIPATAVAVAAVAALLFMRNSMVAPHSADKPVVAEIATQDYEVVADLDDLLASDENNLWTDNSSL
ncbi:MAG: hypothetical protein QOI04_934 [Verrucomicrobiota bacterium]|jgi:anti-sigma-K factor RskA